MSNIVTLTEEAPRHLKAETLPSSSTEDVLDRLAELEDRITTRDSLLARWESGSCVNTLKDGQQLARGVLAKHMDKYKVGKSELGYRMQFAQKYSTPEEVSTAVETLRTWTAIKKSLPKKPRKQSPDSPTQRLIDMLENHDYNAINDEERPKRRRKPLSR